MCGIVGLITKGGIYPEDILRNMTRRIAHRGPDGEGVRIEGPVGLGHRRLSIIDPTGGHQPMSNEDGSVWITFNGEIYNYKELMTQLQSRGHQFKTRSDTEVVIHAWEEWGDCCVDRFRGMFAFGIADYRQGCVFLARDHFGIKPLVWCETEEAISFGSEISPLLLTPGFNGSLDLTAIDQYLWLQYIPSPSSAYRQIRKLPPAHRLRVGFDGAVEKPRRYWSMRFDPEPGVSAADWEERIATVVKESVDAHLMSDVPFGAFLSGGVDSSLVVAEMSELLSDRVRTFSIGFKESEFDETSYAAFAAKTCATIHTRGEMGSDALSLLPSLVQHYGEPFGDSSALPTWHVCKLARASVPMVLSGDGADELFAGYGTQASWMSNPTSNVYDWIRCIHYTDGPVRSALWRPEFQSAFQPRQELFEQLWSESQSFSGLARVQYMDINTYLPFDILTKVDIASMMHGLEVRTPFVDLRVIEEAAKLPSSFSMIRAGDGSWNRKAMLKRVARRFFPDAFLNRPKMGFAMPVARWLAPGGEAYSKLMARLLGEDSSLREYFRPTVMKTLLEGAATPTLWLLLFLEEWLRQHRDLPLPSKAQPAEIHSKAPAEERAETPVQAADLVTKAAERGDLRAARRGLRQLVAQWPHSPAGIIGSQWLALNPPGPPPRRPRLLIIADVPNWIFDRHAHVMQERLADEFDIDIAYGMDIKFRGQPVDEARYDLIHPLEWHMVNPEHVRTPAKWVAGIRSHTSWDGWEPSALAQHLNQLYQGGVYVVSQRLLSIFQPELPAALALPHGVDTEFFSSRHAPQATPGKLRVGWAGNRAAAIKGYDAFIAPLATLPGVELEICGYSDRMLTLDEMRGFYESIDVYICTSASEGHNNSLMEAASMARAIVTTDVGTVPEFLEDGLSALIVPRDFEAISQAILRLRDDPALRQRLGARARESVCGHFDWRARMEDYRRFFKQALARLHPAPGASDFHASQPAAQAFLFEPEWNAYEWVEVLHGYLTAFSPDDPVALIILIDPTQPGQIDPAEAGQSVLEVMASMNQEAFPKVVLVDRPEEILEQIKPYPHISWVRSGQWNVESLRGILGQQLSQSLKNHA
ncbi:asparagine synthase (glutamine-hydrolyzing) [Geothrix sp. PMB-07]|uniref:asparagine synthase (glutamine-hydrolyzing) n=1 Tax=Geothrix sp. PMB-07 TaxID=3068640 RepID=UPI0027416230|nr:asparagine synthase (glutamine-hydrolyzing) [Geothrix sp. PMB-07]WLT31789.1 asparagine synthase (glutamine-hydrolyzing) [Geothrix sp. PMB-07]